DGPNVRQAYDAAWLDWEKDPWRVISFWSHPVIYVPQGVFNDYSNSHFQYGGVRNKRPRGGPGHPHPHYYPSYFPHSHFFFSPPPPPPPTLSLPAAENGATSSMCTMPATTMGGIGTSRQWSRQEASVPRRPAPGRWEQSAASHSPMRTGAPVWGFRSTRHRVTRTPAPVRSEPSIRFSRTAITLPRPDSPPMRI